MLDSGVFELGCGHEVLVGRVFSTPNLCGQHLRFGTWEKPVIGAAYWAVGLVVGSGRCCGLLSAGH